MSRSAGRTRRVSLQSTKPVHSATSRWPTKYATTSSVTRPSWLTWTTTHACRASACQLKAPITLSKRKTTQLTVRTTVRRRLREASKASSPSTNPSSSSKAKIAETTGSRTLAKSMALASWHPQRRQVSKQAARKTRSQPTLRCRTQRTTRRQTSLPC